MDEKKIKKVILMAVVNWLIEEEKEDETFAEVYNRFDKKSKQIIDGASEREKASMMFALKLISNYANLKEALSCIINLSLEILSEEEAKNNEI